MMERTCHIPSLSPSLLARLHDRCGTSSFHPHLPFVVGPHRVGRISPAVAGELARWPSVFKVTSTQVELCAGLNSIELRTEALSRVAHMLHQEGWFSGWRNETFAVAPAYGEAPLFYLERAAMRAFGLTMYAAHLNGIVALDAGDDMWLARRSMSKQIDPGCYDTLVGGGLGDGRGVTETLIRESWEEAGITPELARQATPAGTVRVSMPVSEGWHDEVIFIHDLPLPAGFAPHNSDGEVDEFVRLPLPEILRLVSDTDDVTVPASFIICDYMLRNGFIAPDTPGYSSLLALIHST